MTTPLLPITQYRELNGNLYFFPNTTKSSLQVWKYTHSGEFLNRITYPETTVQQFIASLSKTTPPRKEECMQEIKGLIKKVEFELQASTEESLNCSLCYEIFDKNTNILNCAHSLHSQCIDKVEACSTCTEKITSSKPNYMLQDFIVSETPPCCHICTKIFDETMYALNCAHSFHRNCLENVSACPKCEEKITSSQTNYTLRDCIAAKKPIPTMQAAEKIVENPKSAATFIERALNALKEGNEERAFTEFTKAFNHTSRWEDYQKLVKALEAHPSSLSTTAKQKILLATLYLAEYQLQSGKNREALETLSHYFLLNSDVEDMLNEVVRLTIRQTENGSLRNFFYPLSYRCSHDDPEKLDATTVATELQGAEETLQSHSSWVTESEKEELERKQSEGINRAFNKNYPQSIGRDLLSSIYDLQVIRNAILELAEIVTYCQNILNRYASVTTYLGFTSSQSGESSFTKTVSEIVQILKTVLEKQKNEAKIQQGCNEVIAALEKAKASYESWSINKKTHDFQKIRNELVELLSRSGLLHRITLPEVFPADFASIPEEHQKNLQLLLHLSKIAEEAKIIDKNPTKKSVITKSLQKIEKTIQEALTEKPTLSRTMQLGCELTQILTRVGKITSGFSSFYTKPNCTLWQLISPLYLLLRETGEHDESTTWFPLRASSLMEPSDTLALLTQMSREEPNEWRVYDSIAKLQKQLPERAPIYLRGACQAMSIPDYEQAKIFLNKAEGCLIHAVPPSETSYLGNLQPIVHFIDSLVRVELASNTNEREMTSTHLKRYLLLSATGQGNSLERMKAAKLMLRLDPENSEMQLIIRSSHIQLKNADPSYPLNKEMISSIRYLLLLIKQENWKEAEEMAKNTATTLKLLPTQATEGEKVKQYVDTFFDVATRAALSDKSSLRSYCQEAIERVDPHLHSLEPMQKTTFAIMKKLPPQQEENATQNVNPLLDPVFATAPFLTVITLTGKNLALGFCETTVSIEMLKEKIEEIAEIPAYQQRLIYRGKQLEDERTLSDYKITTSATLHLVLRLGGSPPSNDW